MNEDQRIPPPIPPYQPERGQEGPQDSLEGPQGLDGADRPERRKRPEGQDRPKDALLTDRQRALESLEAKAAFRSHLTVYLLVMVLLVGIWLFASGFGSFFWPIFPMMGWGLGVAIHGFSLGWDRAPSEEEIAAEMAKLRRRPGQQHGRLEE